MSAPQTAPARRADLVGFVNLSDHPIHLRNRGRDLTLDPSGVFCRVKEGRFLLEQLDGWPVWAREYAELLGLPDAAPGVVYIASGRVARLAVELGRDDVVAPDTDYARRDSQGRVLSVQGFFRPGVEARYGLPTLSHTEAFRGH